MTPVLLYMVMAFICLSIGVTLWSQGRSEAGLFKAKSVPWERTSAVVTGISTQFIGKGRAYCPMYRYTYDGREYRRTSSVGRREGTHRVGDVIEILVNPEDPSESEVAVEWSPLQQEPGDAKARDIKLGPLTFPVSDHFAGRSLEALLLQGLSILAFGAALVLAVLALINWR